MGWLDPGRIYAVIALVGAARAFEIPTMVAIIPALVPRPLVPAATAWFTSANQAGQIVGPVLGGLLYALGPADGLWHRHRAVGGRRLLHRHDARWSARRAPPSR